MVPSVTINAALPLWHRGTNGDLAPLLRKNLPLPSYSEATTIAQRIVSGKPHTEDSHLDTSLRPRSLGDFVGQNKIKANLQIAISAAKARGEALDHLLLYGPPGLGKTTLASIVASELAVNIRITSGPAIERGGDLAAILTNLRAH